MTSIEVHGLDEAVVHILRIRAARNGRTLEAEMRSIIESAIESDDLFGPDIDPQPPYRPPGTDIRRLVAEIGGADALRPHLPQRVSDGMHRVPDFTHSKYGRLDE